MRSNTRRYRRIIALAVAAMALSAAPAIGMPAGDTPADFAQPVAPAPKAGDTPVDYPGASRAQEYDPPPITVVHTTETVVREVDTVLPIALSAVAVLLALSGLGIALVRTGAVPRHRRAH